MFNVGLKRFISSLLTVILIGICYTSCSEVTDTLSSTEEPTFNNPRDPESSSAEPPRAEITNFSSLTGVAIQTHSPEIIWEADTGRVNVNVDFQYRFAAVGETISNKDWSAWSDVTSATYEYLEESLNGGLYTFQVQARSGDLMQATPTELTFTVDAVSGKGPVFYPRKLTNSGGTYSTELYLSGIESSDEVAAVQLQVDYGGDLNVDAVEIYDENSFLGQAGGDIVGFEDFPQSGQLLINIGVLGGDLTQLSGNGPVAEVHFTSSSTIGGPLEISFGNQTILTNKNNSDIPIQNFDSAVIDN